MAKHSPRDDNYDQLNINALFESLFAVSDSALIDASFDGFVESRSTDSHQNDGDFIERAIHLSSVLLEAGKRSARKRSSVHNASVWALTQDLTIKVFSMFDTQSLFCAAATCSFFKKCAADPLCYININLGTLAPKIKPKSKDPNNKDDMVSKMIQRAGSALQSIKIGVEPPYIIDDDDDKWGIKRFQQREESPFLTASCLSSLRANGGVPGSRLRSLHLYRITMKDKTALSDALSASLSVCHSLVELKFVDMHVYISRILESVSRYCRLLEHFIFEFSGGRPDLVETSVCKEFVVNCPKITTLVLQACKLFPSEAFELVKGFNELKYVDFTNCYSLTGAFLEDLATKGGGNSLEVMILRRVYSLDKEVVIKFLNALLAGKFRQLRHLDISKSGGLVHTGDDGDLRYGASDIIPSKKLLKQRPNFCLVNKIC
ncbi:unnamed protein product [Lactuca virosa]|uniref:F-box domain-containing protein n=1 Tax=Lactuca virosa TaxID=75947 RepID=A0AAU9MZ57_9ASTR|nr:unnamed protein product [Lactuca virosa]